MHCNFLRYFVNSICALNFTKFCCEQQCKQTISICLVWWWDLWWHPATMLTCQNVASQIPMQKCTGNNGNGARNQTYDPSFWKRKEYIVYVNYFSHSFIKKTALITQNKKKGIAQTTSGNKGCSTLSIIHMNPSTSWCLIAWTIVAVIGACMSFLFGMRLHA